MVEGVESPPLGLLPEPKVNWPSLAASYTAQAVLVLLVVEFAILHPAKLALVEHHLQYTPLVTSAPTHVAQHLKMKKLLAPAPVTEARLRLPALPRTALHKEAAVVAPKLNNLPTSVAPALTHAGGARPVLAVKTGVFSGSSATPTINKPAAKVQTGGFGDPNGLPANGNSQGKLVMAKVGSFDLPEGGGSANGSGGMHGARGTVASAGFGNGVASPGQGDGRSNGRGAVQTAGFGAAVAPPAAGQPHSGLSAPSSTPVEILSKPRPQYTEEARQLKIEGEVLVAMLFEASGQAVAQRVVRGLGHGLDESALSAASRIRFKPATQNGQPVDSSAVVHVVFQLAY